MTGKSLNAYFDFFYFLKFIIIFLLLYCITLLTIGITDPKNYYSPFIDHNLNYINWLRRSILYTSSAMVHWFGLNSFVHDKVLRVVDGAGVVLNRPCLGLGIINFWIAFIFAHNVNFLLKLKWTLIGIFTIWFINCTRIALLLIALQNKWKVNKYIDHHDLYKYIAWALVGLLVYLFNKIYTNNKRQDVTIA